MLYQNSFRQYSLPTIRQASLMAGGAYSTGSIRRGADGSTFCPEMVATFRCNMKNQRKQNTMAVAALGATTRLVSLSLDDTADPKPFSPLLLADCSPLADADDQSWRAFLESRLPRPKASSRLLRRIQDALQNEE